MAGMKTEVPIKNSASSDGVAAAAKQAAYTEERRRYWDAYARKQPGWDGPRRFYRQRLAELYRFVIPPGSRVLELGCGEGDLLAALRPSEGVGLDLSPARLEQGRAQVSEPASADRRRSFVRSWRRTFRFRRRPRI